LEEIPEEVAWVRGLIPQYERCRGKTVTLVCGLCHKMDERFDYDDFNFQPNAPFTNLVLQAIEVHTKENIFLLDSRKVTTIFPLIFPSHAFLT
jgi:hypothetical protein